MATRIGVLSGDFASATATYFEPTSWLTSFGIPTDTQVMVDGAATFQLDATNNICVRLDAPNGEILRTGVQPASAVGEFEGSDLELPYLIYGLEEVVAFSDLTSGLPPLSQNGATVSNLALTRSGQNLVASADVSYATGVVGNINGTMTYEFRLVPVTTATSASILMVDTIDIDVNISGVAGWFLNGLFDIVTALFEDRIGDALEEVIQDLIDTSIADRLAEEGDVPDNVQATVQSVTLSANDATLDVLVAVPAVVVGCPFNVANGSVKIRKGDQLRKLRRMRSQVLKGNPRGDIYIALMRRHGPELARIMRKNPVLLKKFDALIDAGLNDFDEDRPGNGKLKKRTATLVRSLAAEVGEQSSPRLRRAIAAHQNDVDDFVGKPVSKVFEDSTAAAAEIAKAKQPRRRRKR